MGLTFARCLAATTGASSSSNGLAGRGGDGEAAAAAVAQRRPTLRTGTASAGGGGVAVMARSAHRSSSSSGSSSSGSSSRLLRRGCRRLAPSLGREERRRATRSDPKRASTLMWQDARTVAEILLPHVLLRVCAAAPARGNQPGKARRLRVWRARRGRRAWRAGGEGEANAESADVGTLLAAAPPPISTLPPTRG